MPEQSSYQKVMDEAQQEARELALKVRDGLQGFARGLPHVERTESQKWGERYEFHAYDKEKNILCKVSVKTSRDWRGKFAEFVVYAVVSGGYAGSGNRENPSDTRSQVYRVASLEKLDSAKGKLQRAVEATWEYDRRTKADERQRKATGRSNARIFKEAGYKTTGAAGYDIDDDGSEEQDWMFGTEITGEKDGLRVGVKANGELMVRLPDTMTFEDFLKKLG